MLGGITSTWCISCFPGNSQPQFRVNTGKAMPYLLVEMSLCLICTGFLVWSPTPAQQASSSPHMPPANVLTQCPTKSWCHAIEGPLLLFWGTQINQKKGNNYSDWALEWVHTVLVMATLWLCLMGGREDHKD